jgi:hypothetical protein
MGRDRVMTRGIGAATQYAVAHLSGTCKVFTPDPTPILHEGRSLFLSPAPREQLGLFPAVLRLIREYVAEAVIATRENRFLR